MLRASSQQNDQAVNLAAIMDGHTVSGIAAGEYLVAYAEAVVSRAPSRITAAREALSAALGSAAVVDAAGVISNFQRMVRIADATGIGLGVFEVPSADMREALGINAFRHHD